jgi:ligand-binding sensor domain-containing protein
MRPKFFLLILISLVWNVSVAQNLHLTYFSETNGLLSNQVRHVVHDSMGFLWIAGDAGLLRFDGVNFSNYSQQVPSRYGHYLCNTPEGLLLSHDAGISLIKPGLDTSMISLLWPASIDPDEEALYYPGRIFRQKNGDVWISQPGGRISRYSGGQKKDFTSPALPSDHSLVSAFFAEPENGPLWIAFSDGRIFLFDEASQELEEVSKLSSINDMKSLGQDLWIAGDHVKRIRLTQDLKQIIDTKTYYSNLGEVSALSLDSKGNIFLGIREKGLYFLDRRQDQSPRFIQVFSNNDPHRVDELPFKNIHNIVMESDDELWICSDEGLGILQRRFFESLGSIPNANATSICMAENGKIFVNFGDIYAIDRTDIGYEGAPLQNYTGATITALSMAGNLLWAGSSTGQLFHLNQDGSIIARVDLRPRGEGIYCLTEDSKQRLWVCQAPEDQPLVGIGCVLPNGALVEYGYEQGLESRVLNLVETNKGRIYCSAIGLDSYLYRYLPEEDAFINISLPLDFSVSSNFEVHDLAMDENGVIWLASTNGLLKYEMDRISRVSLGENNTDIEIRAVVSMNDGSVWASTDTEGIVRYKDGEVVVIKEESGLPSKVMSYRCLVKDREGRLWVGSAEGIVYSLDINPEPKSSVEPLLISASVEGTKGSLEAIQMFVDQELCIEVIAPSFHGFRTFYQHRVNKAEWSAPTTQHDLVVHGWEPGSYEIEIRSRKEGGFLWSSPLTTDITVREYWYQQRLLLWISLVLLISLLSWYLVNRKRKYSHDISVLTRGLQTEKEVLEKKDADLQKAQKDIKQDQLQMRIHMLSLDIMHRLISKISPGMKWDLVLEILSIDLIRFPGVVAFEIGVRKGKEIEFEGFSEEVKSFTSSHIPFAPDTNLASYTLNASKSIIFNNIPEDAQRLISAPDKRLVKYKSAISVPFYLENERAILSLYSNKPGLFDDYSLKAMGVFASYLEQIIEP